ncbi:MAG: TspO/MBR family protein [Ruminococcus sp.]
MVLIHNFDVKKLSISCSISLGIGALSSFISMFGRDNFENAIKPPLNPPTWLFPIVWTILFLLMGISAYLVYKSDSDDDAKTKALTAYGVQLLINFFWPIIFFNFSAYLLSSIWIIVLLISIIVMIKLFYDIDKIAAYLQIPYLIWVVFATYLTIAITILN